jgi:30S ribosomal protein S31
LPFFVTFTALIKIFMGRGDKKTKKGKIFKGSFGKIRLSKATKQNKAVATISANA